MSGSPKTTFVSVLANPVGEQDNFPREGILAMAGFTRSDQIPIVVLIDTRSNCVFHAQRTERKYERLFGRP